MDARLKRIAADWEQVQKDFAGHKYITVSPVAGDPPEKYHVTYHVNGIYLQPDGKIETLNCHEVEITLHAEYPRYKPVCKILTPIWHPNFRDGQICIGDIWGAGESLSDIIINIGDMIQYKSWNSTSPLSADAAAWAVENKFLFPVGNIELNIADDGKAMSLDDIEIDGDEAEDAPAVPVETPAETQPLQETDSTPGGTFNDFEITADELKDIEYIPTAQRMQGGINHGENIKVKINFKTVLFKGLIWALIGAFVGFAFGELAKSVFPDSTVASLLGYKNLAKYYKYHAIELDLGEELYDTFEDYCDDNGLDPDADGVFAVWIQNTDIETGRKLSEYTDACEKSEDYLEDAYRDDFGSNEEELESAVARVTRLTCAIWCSAIALFIGLFMGIGEGVYYGSKKKAIRYGLIGAAVSLVIGAVSGYMAQWMYGSVNSDDVSSFVSALIRGAGWSIMGLGVGAAVGFIKPELKRIGFCAVGGLTGAFIGGFLFEYISLIITNDVVARCLALLIMGALIGIGVGLLEQFAKSAWLKVIRGEFEGKEYLVFPGVTSIGNNSSNTIVLFKDKLVEQHHCDIILHGTKYVLRDCSTSMGTVVNGMKTKQRILQQGDAIAVGNSILVFNCK